jgi:GMP synthase (glutamine-hydrolysing)
MADKEILIIKNIPHEGPGLLKDVIIEHGLKYSIIDLCNETIEKSLKNISAVIVLGGPDSANDKTKRISDELTFISEILKASIPYLGICLGLQTLVKAAGGEVVKCHTQEIGFRDGNGDFYKVELTEEGKKDTLFIGLKNPFTVFQLHGETVILNDKMKLLASGNDCHNQIVKVGQSAYGIQCHFELTHEMFNLWINKDPDLMKLDKKQLLYDYLSIKNDYENTGKILLRNFLKIANLVS